MNMISIMQGIIDFILMTGNVGVLISSLVIIVESIIPIIPVLVFVSINFMILGNISGFIISWICMIVGCLISYFIFKNGFGNHFERLTKDKERIKKYSKLFKNIRSDKLLLLIAFPFTPAFLVNIAAGLVKMDFKKYFLCIVIGKISLVVYSAYIGISFVESLTNPIMLLKILIVMLIVYLFGIIIKKIVGLNV